jgi:hypothetical protein
MTKMPSAARTSAAWSARIASEVVVADLVAAVGGGDVRHDEALAEYQTYP